ncbi:MAG: flagellar biosynthetic protein FliR [Pirellulales bacterium]|nr:flagellar biosynthetic protein FliR [Pirellulales bacterium]
MSDVEAWLPVLFGGMTPYTLVLLRVGGMLATAPLFGARVVPVRVRALIALALAVAVAPASASSVVPDQPATYVLAAAAEVLIGVALGVGLRSLFVAMQLAGGIISLTSGLNLADVYNPDANEHTPLVAHFFELVSVTLFVAIGGHRLLVAGLLDTFTALPPGRVGVDRSTVGLLTSLAGESLSLALAVAAPALAALLLASLIVGLVSRTLPQLNLLVVGFGLNTAVTFAVLVVMFGALAWTFDDRLEPLLQSLMSRLSPGHESARLPL